MKNSKYLKYVEIFFKFVISYVLIYVISVNVINLVGAPTDQTQVLIVVCIQLLLVISSLLVVILLELIKKNQ